MQDALVVGIPSHDGAVPEVVVIAADGVALATSLAEIPATGQGHAPRAAHT